jgi:hypothetical protein
MGCETGLYGEECRAPSTEFGDGGYNPFYDFDLGYWIDTLLSGSFSLIGFVASALMWVGRMVVNALDLTGSVATQIFTAGTDGMSYHNYISAVFEDGDILNDWLTHAPTESIAVVWLVVGWFLNLLTVGGI